MSNESLVHLPTMQSLRVYASIAVEKVEIKSQRTDTRMRMWSHDIQLTGARQPTPLNSHRNICEPRNPRTSPKHVATMAPISLSDIISSLPSEDSWGPPTSTETTLNGVPYAPYSKGDKLGRMADWTTEGKDGRDGRGGRQQYNRNYRGTILRLISMLPYICYS
jgi:hypothetical protein